MSENNSKKTHATRPLSRAELHRYREEFGRLATQFEEDAANLRRSPDNLAMVAELRSTMARAGWLLGRLIHHGAIAAPVRLPPWLSWRTKGQTRPWFRALRGRPFHGSWSPKRTVLGLVQVLRAGPAAVDTATPRRPHEDDGAAFIRRHTWIEAVAGWLGQRCTPRLHVRVPTVQAVVDTGRSEDQGEGRRIPIVHDWVEGSTDQHLLFLDLGRDGAVACRHLSAQLDGLLTAPHVESASNPNPWPTPLSTFDALDDLRTDISHGSGAAGIEAFDTLFGTRNLHAELEALAGRRKEFKRRFAGKREPRSIADFAVTSGLEAVATFADRLAKTAGVRRSTIPRSRDALDDARHSNDAVRVDKCQVDLELAGQNFAQTLAHTLNGWDEHRGWIRRSIEDEDVMENDGSPISQQTGLGLVRPNAWDARDAFHRAVLSIYSALGTLINHLKKEPNLRVALLVLDEHATPGSVPEGDTEFVADLKHSAARLRASLATAREIRNKDRRASRVGGHDGCFAGMAGISLHDAVMEAAQEVLEPDEEGAARSGRIPRLQSACGTMRMQVVTAAMDAKLWLQLAKDLEQEYELASLLPHSPTGEPDSGEVPSKNAQPGPPEDSNFAEAMARYHLSCDELRTLRINPRKAIPIGQYPEELVISGAAIFRRFNEKKYAQYVSRVAAQNERFIRQAQLWWTWWEKTQTDPSKAGPMPLVSSRLEAALRIAAAQRAQSPSEAILHRDAMTAVHAAPDATKPTAAATKVDPGRLVTIQEAAEILPAPEKTIRNWVNRKSDPLKVVDRLGGPRRIAARYRLTDLLARRPERSTPP